MSNYIVALDFGSDKIAGMVARRGADDSLEIIAVASENSVGVRRGLINNYSAAAASATRIIDRLQQDANIIIDKVYAGIGGHTMKSLAQKQRLSSDSEQEFTREQLDELCKRNFELSPDGNTVYDAMPQEAVIDGDVELNPEGCVGSSLEAGYLLATGQPSIELRLCHCIERIPQKLAASFVLPFTTAEILVSPEEKESGVAVIDFGAETTTVVVYAEHFMRHMAVIPFGGKSITQDIRSLKVTEANAERLKKEYGYALQSLDTEPKTINIKTGGQDNPIHSKKDLNLIIQSRVDEILEMVCEEIYKSGYMDKLAEGIIITGGASQLRGIEQFVELKSGMKVRHGNYTQQLVPETKAEFINPAYTTLLGLLSFGKENCTMKEKIDEPVAPVVQPKPAPTNKSSLWGKIKRRGMEIVDDAQQKMFEDHSFE
ncbi:MAG: cell division protein FtsA [Prevotellaceae bacterium]|jgi:cell division protein FtsA|nr:cell division protein FtsA [Prevotellaceae bacterium]